MVLIKPRVYYVNGTAAAKVGDHLFKNVVSGYGSDISRLKEVANVIELCPGSDGVYYLHEEGCGTEYGECYLVASQGVSAGGCIGEDGSIGAILSPIHSYEEYVKNKQSIKDLLALPLDDRLGQSLRRMLYIGVCGEMEGYLSRTSIALIMGVRDVFLSLRESGSFQVRNKDEVEWKNEVVHKINDCYLFQHICSRDGKERALYEQLIGHKLPIYQELIDAIKWRDKLAHRVPFYIKPTYPTKEDVLSFIEQTDRLVEYIDKQLTHYKSYWLKELG